jgi:hypothetical protein
MTLKQHDALSAKFFVQHFRKRAGPCTGSVLCTTRSDMWKGAVRFTNFDALPANARKTNIMAYISCTKSKDHDLSIIQMLLMMCIRWSDACAPKKLRASCSPSASISHPHFLISSREIFISSHSYRVPASEDNSD